VGDICIALEVCHARDFDVAQPLSIFRLIFNGPSETILRSAKSGPAYNSTRGATWHAAWRKVSALSWTVGRKLQ